MKYLQVGYSSGINGTFYTVAGSRTDDIVNIDEKSNIDKPGRWLFRVENESILIKESCPAAFAYNKNKVLLLNFPSADVNQKVNSTERCRASRTGNGKCTNTYRFIYVPEAV